MKLFTYTSRWLIKMLLYFEVVHEDAVPVGKVEDTVSVNRLKVLLY